VDRALRGNGGAEQGRGRLEGAARVGEVTEVVAGQAETLLPARQIVARRDQDREVIEPGGAADARRGVAPPRRWRASMVWTW